MSKIMQNCVCTLPKAGFGEGIDTAFEYFEKGFQHIRIYKSIRCQGEYRYSVPLVSKVTFPGQNFLSLSKSFLERLISVLPDDMKERIKEAPKYA